MHYHINKGNPIFVLLDDDVCTHTYYIYIALHKVSSLERLIMYASKLLTPYYESIFHSYL